MALRNLLSLRSETFLICNVGRICTCTDVFAVFSYIYEGLAHHRIIDVIRLNSNS